MHKPTQWTMRMGVGVLAGLSMGLSACALEGTWPPTTEPTIYPPAVFSHRVGTSHVVLYWNCTQPEPGVLRLDGVAQNPHSPQEVRFLELDLAGVDAQDRFVSETKGAVRNFLLRLNEISPFQLDLRLAGTEVRFDLFYQYRFHEDGGHFLAGPPVGGPHLFAQEQRFMARDVCSETQHRVR